MRTRRVHGGEHALASVCVAFDLCGLGCDLRVAPTCEAGRMFGSRSRLRIESRRRILHVFANGCKQISACDLLSLFVVGSEGSTRMHIHTMELFCVFCGCGSCVCGQSSIRLCVFSFLVRVMFFLVVK